MNTVHPDDQEEARRIIRGASRRKSAPGSFATGPCTRGGGYRWVEAKYYRLPRTRCRERQGRICRHHPRYCRSEKPGKKRVAAEFSRRFRKVASLDELNRDRQNRRALQSDHRWRKPNVTRAPTRDLSLMPDRLSTISKRYKRPVWASGLGTRA